MLPIDPVYHISMTDYQRAWFNAEYQQARKEEVIGVLLALFLGGLGIHHFYLRRTGLGILYLVFSWTGIPAILGVIECFFMPGRVRAYNAAQAAYISGEIIAASPVARVPPAETQSWPATAAGGLTMTVPCSACGQPIDPAAAFCPHCGAKATTRL